jgi:hypothetical protein
MENRPEMSPSMEFRIQQVLIYSCHLLTLPAPCSACSDGGDYYNSLPWADLQCHQVKMEQEGTESSSMAGQGQNSGTPTASVPGYFWSGEPGFPSPPHLANAVALSRCVCVCVCRGGGWRCPAGEHE